MEKTLETIRKTLDVVEKLTTAKRTVEFDQVTVCPNRGQEAAADAAVALDAEIYRLKTDPAFTAAVLELYAKKESLNKWEAAMVTMLYREVLHTKHFTHEQKEQNDRIKKKAWLAWRDAMDADDYKLFEASLDAVCQSEKARVSLWEAEAPEIAALSDYGRMLSEYEYGMTVPVLDRLFAESERRISALLERIRKKGKRIRTDFLSRRVTDAQQERLADYLLSLLQFDRQRGTFATSEHPFTEMLSKDDIRVTTHYYPNMFLSSLYSILHECGHALFEQLQPEENHIYHIADGKTMGMHESVSRFYENVIGRSAAFIHLIYPKLFEIFPQVFFDVTERELFEAVNLIQPSLIRIDADELTYTFHIIIRYEIEKELIDGTLKASDVPSVWNRKYREYLGVMPSDDREGVLQDDHWTSSLGYFPTYALGNFYNAMYANAMRKDFDLDAAIADGNFQTINDWMRERVFRKADRVPADAWIREITGREVTADDFLTYLEEKYEAVYGLSGKVKNVNEHFDEYTRRMKKIQLLSSPQLNEINTADAYSAVLLENFRSIGELARENRLVMDDVINPILMSSELLSEELIDQIRDMNASLMDAMTHENIDLPVMAMLSERLMLDAEKKEDTAYLIRQLDEEMIACVALVVQTRRIISGPEITETIRKRGVRALETLLTFLDKDRFLSLDMESRELVMINSRYGDGLFISMTPLSPEERSYRFRLLERSLALSEDPFYREALPDYDWNYHRYRIYQYFSSYDEFDNAAANDAEQLKQIAYYGQKLDEMWLSDQAYYGEIDDYSYIHSHAMRNLLHAGQISREEYCETLYSLYQKRDPNRYDVDAIIGNIEIPSEILAALQPGELTAEQQFFVDDIYRTVISYVFRMPKLGIFYELMDYYAPLLFHFVEIPGGVTFEQMGLQSFAAFHPPTYIHSIMVARITRCLTKHLLQKKPELFTGICGCPSVDEVPAYSARIIAYAYHAALCHDFGKLIIIDTVFVYGRKILDFEFDIIKQHPSLGAMLLERHESTKAFVDVARGHHVWYDGKKGYPGDFDTSGSPVKTIIDLVACADCMDAATDAVGRSYNTGKTLEQYIEEVKEAAGTRYAPYLPELLSDPSVHRDMEFLLTTGRQEVYRNTYLLLRGVQNNDG